MENRKPLGVELLDPSLHQFNKVLTNAFNVDASKPEAAGKIYQVLWDFIALELFATDRLDQKIIIDLFDHYEKQLTEESWLKAHGLIEAKASPAKFAMLKASVRLFKALTLLRWMMTQLQAINDARQKTEKIARNYLLGIVTFAYKNPADNTTLLAFESQLSNLRRCEFKVHEHPLIVAYKNELNQDLDKFLAAQEDIWKSLEKLSQRADVNVKTFHLENAAFYKHLARMTLRNGVDSALAASSKRLVTITQRITQLKANFKAKNGLFDEKELTALEALLQNESESWQEEWQSLVNARSARVTARTHLELDLLKERLVVEKNVTNAMHDLELSKRDNHLSPALQIVKVVNRNEYATLRELKDQLKQEMVKIRRAQIEAQKGQEVIAAYCKDTTSVGLQKIEDILYAYPISQYYIELEKARELFIREADNQFTLLGSQYYRLWSGVKTELEKLFSLFLPSLASDVQYIQTIKALDYINGVISPLQKLANEFLESGIFCEKYAKRLQDALDQYALLFENYERRLNKEKEAAFETAGNDFERLKKHYLARLVNLLQQVQGQSFQLDLIRELPVDPMQAEFAKAQQSLEKIRKKCEPPRAVVALPEPKRTLKQQVEEVERVTLATRPVKPKPVAASDNVKKQPSFLQRYWRELVSGGSGAVAGATLGFLLGMFFAPVTFGAAPFVFAVIGATIFAGFGVFGFIGVERCVASHRKAQVNKLQPRKTSEIFNRLSINPKQGLTNSQEPVIARRNSLSRGMTAFLPRDNGVVTTPPSVSGAADAMGPSALRLSRSS